VNLISSQYRCGERRRSWRQMRMGGGEEGENGKVDSDSRIDAVDDSKTILAVC
jgi:hypothetical protein